MRVIGKRPSDKNPHVCGQCFDYIAKNHGGAEVDDQRHVRGHPRLDDPG